MENKRISLEKLEEMASVLSRIPEEKQKEVLNFVKGYAFAAEIEKTKKAAV